MKHFPWEKIAHQPSQWLQAIRRHADKAGRPPGEFEGKEPKEKGETAKTRFRITRYVADRMSVYQTEDLEEALASLDSSVSFFTSKKRNGFKRFS